MASNYTTENRSTATGQHIEDVKSTAKEVANQAGEAARDVTSQVKAKAEETADQVRQQTANMAADTKQKAESVASKQKDKAADQIDGFASALRQAGQELKNQEQESVAQYVDAAAEQVESMSGYLRNHNVSDLFSEVNRFAKQQPEVFIACSLAAGFFMGRVLRSSASSDQQADYRRYEYERQAQPARGYDNRRNFYGAPDYATAGRPPYPGYQYGDDTYRDEVYRDPDAVGEYNRQSQGYGSSMPAVSPSTSSTSSTYPPYVEENRGHQQTQEEQS